MICSAFYLQLLPGCLPRNDPAPCDHGPLSGGLWSVVRVGLCISDLSICATAPDDMQTCVSVKAPSTVGTSTSRTDASPTLFSRIAIIACPISLVLLKRSASDLSSQHLGGTDTESFEVGEKVLAKPQTTRCSPRIGATLHATSRTGRHNLLFIT